MTKSFALTLALTSLGLSLAHAPQAEAAPSSAPSHLMLGAMANQDCRWPLWQDFRRHYVQDGRVVDTSDPRMITTSEGQSYGMFFALVANDRETFAKLVDWTQSNLAKGDFTQNLPAWLWGQLPNQEYGILDSNPASDSDLWIAYSLLEAGRIWQNDYYTILGRTLSRQILAQEVKNLDGLGESLLPGPVGFESEAGARLNPSYVPPQLLARFAQEFPDLKWKQVEQASIEILIKTMPLGYSPDWVLYKDGEFKPDEDTQSIGSYNAIRTYLWAGMLDDNYPAKQSLVQAMQPVIDYLVQNKAMPESFDAQTGQAQGTPDVGFDAALIPLLRSQNKTQLADAFAKKAVDALPRLIQDHYYARMLTMFGLGYDQGFYHFDEHGQVKLKWETGCQ